MTDEILFERSDRVALITINRPQKKNALSWSALAGLRTALERADADDAVRAVVITGAGGAFCAGTDLSELSRTDPSARGGSQGEASPWMVQSCSKPVLAAIDGPAVGLGAEIATQADIRIVSTMARIAWNFVHRGLVPDTGAASYLLPRQIGLSAALRLLMSGEFLTADEAVRSGFAIEVVEPPQLLEKAIEMATAMTHGSPMSVRLVKDLVYQGLGRSVPDHLTANRSALQDCFRSEDHREGVASFLERRPPRFTGR